MNNDYDEEFKPIDPREFFTWVRNNKTEVILNRVGFSDKLNATFVGGDCFVESTKTLKYVIVSDKDLDISSFTKDDNLKERLSMIVEITEFFVKEDKIVLILCEGEPVFEDENSGIEMLFSETFYGVRNNNTGESIIITL